MFEVEKFTESGISGVVGRPGIVELFLGDELVESVVASYDAGRGTCVFRFRNPSWPVVGARSLTVRASGYLRDPEIADEVVGYMPRRHDIGEAMDVYYRQMTNYPEVPQEMLNYIGSGEAGQAGYRSIGYTMFSQILAATGFRATDRILDIGTGAGRIAFAIAPYLQGGTVLGLDTWREGIAWADANLQPLFPSSLRFEALPSPPQGHRRGYLADHVAPLALDAASFDLVICTSLFTHLRKEACRGYFEQIARLLRPDGLAFVTGFLIRGDEADHFRYHHKHVNEFDDYGFYIVDDTYCDSFVYADEFFGVAAAAGLKVCHYSPGIWMGENASPSRVSGSNFQCYVVLRRA